VRMRNDKILMTKEIRNPKSEFRTGSSHAACRIRSFELGHSFDIRHSDFVIVQSLLTSAATIL
jgi:hypothetical protein